MAKYSVDLKTATVPELADIVNNRNNPQEYRDAALATLQVNARKEYANLQLGLPRDDSNFFKQGR